MDSIGDWLYVVILVVAGISSLIGSISKSKKRANETRPQQAPQEEFDEEDMTLEPWMPTVLETPSSPYSTQPPSFSSPSSPAALMSSRGMSRFHTLESVTESYTSAMHFTSTSPVLEIEEDHAALTLEDLPADVDDWRKALVYNEILKPKYQ